MIRTLQRAFLGEDIPLITRKIIDGSCDPIPKNLRYSDKLRRLVDLLLQKDPKLRPQAARILTLPLSELQMSNFVVETMTMGEKSKTSTKTASSIASTPTTG